MSKQHYMLLLCTGVFLAACSEELPPRTVQEFLDDPLLLEAAVVRCSQNRTESRYTAECANARQAASIIETRTERERAAAFEAQSERKRQALRQTQEAVAEARRRAEEAERLRSEAEYLAQFGELPPSPDEGSQDTESPGNMPVAVVPESEESSASENDADPVSVEGTNAPQATPTDLDAIRQELQRRNEPGSD